MSFIACEEVTRLGLDSREQDRAIFFRQEDAGWKVAVRAIRDQLDVYHQPDQTLALFLGFQIPTRFLEGVTRREQGRV